MWQGPKSIEVLYTSVDCEDCSKEMSILIIRATSVPEQLQKLQRKLTEKEAKIASKAAKSHKRRKSSHEDIIRSSRI